MNPPAESPAVSSSRLFALALIATVAGAPLSMALAAEPPAKAAPAAAPKPLEGLKYRLIGPFRGGRATGVAGIAGDPTTFYFGAAAGGLWKTTDGGTSWKPLWDHFPEASQAVGAVAVAPSDPKVVYAGTGEINIRGNVVTGNGLYKSVDAGKTWKFSGLRDTQVIGRIIVDPKDPNRLFVAALGHIFGDNSERGVFRSTDGGATWTKVLYVDAKTGGSDVQFDPSNPRILYAGMWQAHRKPWIMESGGPGSGLYKSTDGGDTWQRLEGGGLPEGIYGRVNVAPTSNPNRVYAMIEAGKGGLYRSDDAGRTWALINDKNDYRQRAWYFNTVFADPKDADVVYVLNTQLYRSKDAGKTFKALHVRHGDTHELWIDPTDPKRMINGNDGGANITVDAGETWTTEMNQPTAQFYHISTDDQFPFRVYGDQQDNSSISIASAGRGGGVGIEDWYPVGGGESGFIIPHPKNPEIVFGGGYDAELTRYDHRTDDERQITPWARNIMGWAPKDQKYRFQWTAPIMVSRHEPHALYFGANVLFRSTDEGHSWTIISPDLTRDDKSKQEASGGPLTKDNTSVETYDTIFAVAEAASDPNQIWAGTDDGLVHITRDLGAHWSNVTPTDMPEWATIDMIDPDPRKPGAAYVAADRHRLDDFKPYAFRTDDYGKTWTAITEGIPDGAYVHAVRVDPKQEGLLYAGTERGVFVSHDDGAHWRPLQLNLPVAPVNDLVVHGDSLAVATHGRSFWILDDLGPVRQWSDGVEKERVHLFTPAPANHTVFRTQARALRESGGANPPAGAAISWWLSPDVGTARPAPGADDDKDKDAKDKKDKKPDPFAKRIKLEILDANGQVIRTYPDPRAEDAPKPDGKGKVQAAGKTDKTQPEAHEAEEDEEGPPKPAPLPHLAGLNTYVWDLRYDAALAIPHSPLWAGSVAGPKAVPGRYQARLTVDGKSYVQPIEVVPDPRGTATQDELQAQFTLHTAINAKLTEVHQAVLDIRAARARIKAREAASPASKPAGEALDARITAIEEVLIQPRARASEDALNYPVRLNNQLAALGVLVAAGDNPPTAEQQRMWGELRGEADVQLAAWKQVRDGELKSYLAKR
jgi:photosystem II stability/assembly factor-like uncharacterized protein